MMQLLEGTALVGAPLLEVVQVKKPRDFDENVGLHSLLGKRLTITLTELSDQVSSSLFGMAFEVACDDQPSLLIALTPGVNAKTFIQKHGLHMSDFGPADGSADLMPLLAMQEEMLNDSRLKSKKLAAARDEAERLANTDSLTGLPNRRALIAHFDAVREAAVTVLHLDLDKFKEINDRFGHAAGDAALKHTASIVRNHFGKNGFWARLGGDEFIGVILDHSTEVTMAMSAELLLHALATPYKVDDQTITVRGSVGMLRIEAGEMTEPDEVLKKVDVALYEAKGSETGAVAQCTPELLHAQASAQAKVKDIERGLNESEFCAHLQPQFDASTGLIIGVEALARWKHSEQSLLGPQHFLDLAADVGLIKAVDMQVRRSALDAFSMARQRGLHIPKLSLNTTIHDLTDSNFRATLAQDLADRGLTPSCVTLEIVESVFFDDKTSNLIDTCTQLESDGFTLALDDFGTGHASALSLVNLPLSIVKIDRAFAAHVAQDLRREAMARSMVTMSQALGLEVIAEGVESQADVALFQDMGCHQFQAFLFGKPMAPSDLYQRLRDAKDGSKSDAA